MGKKAFDIFIDTNLCKGCKICIYVCPHNVFRMSKDISIRGYHTAEVANKENCVGCQLCTYSCPDFAICVVETS